LHNILNEMSSHLLLTGSSYDDIEIFKSYGGDSVAWVGSMDAFFEEDAATEQIVAHRDIAAAFAFNESNFGGKWVVRREFNLPEVWGNSSVMLWIERK